MSKPRHTHPSLRALLPMLAATALLAACSANRPYAYVKDAPRDEEMPITNNYTTTIFVGDRLDIHVDSRTPQSTYPFNEDTRHATRVPGTKAVVRGGTDNGYVVAPDSTIYFPGVGNIHAAGLTLDQMARAIEGRLVDERLVKDPTVTVKMKGFHVTVVGEVKTPQLVQAEGYRLTILEAIAMCGDVTMDGLRDNVKVIRFDSEEPTVGEIDLTSKEAFDSPYYYLKQNDIIYVEPTPKRKRQAYRNEDWPRYISMTASGVSIAYTLVYRMLINERTRISNQK